MEGGSKPQKLWGRMQALAREQAWLGIGDEVPALASNVDEGPAPARPTTDEANAQPQKPEFSHERSILILFHFDVVYLLVINLFYMWDCLDDEAIINHLKKCGHPLNSPGNR